MNIFEHFVGTFEAEDYEFTVNYAIDEYNDEFDPAPSLTRTILAGDDGTTYFAASVVTPNDVPTRTAASTAYDEVYNYYQTEQSVEAQDAFSDTVTDFQADSYTFIQAFDDLETFSIDVLQNKLGVLDCSLDPIFEKFDELLYGNDTAWCSPVGVVYGKMKAKTCDDLFTNFEYVNRSILVIAIFSMIIGFLAVALCRRIDRIQELGKEAEFKDYR
eukprot:UN29957